MRMNPLFLTRSEAYGGGGVAPIGDATEGALTPHDAPTVTMRIRIAPPPPFYGLRRRSR
jgi:hypothetical protein